MNLPHPYYTERCFYPYPPFCTPSTCLPPAELEPRSRAPLMAGSGCEQGGGERRERKEQGRNEN
eukprot:759136-Hanusia_phi.AAC.5